MTGALRAVAAATPLSRSAPSRACISTVRKRRASAQHTVRPNRGCALAYSCKRPPSASGRRSSPGRPPHRRRHLDPRGDRRAELARHQRRQPEHREVVRHAASRSRPDSPNDSRSTFRWTRVAAAIRSPADRPADEEAFPAVERPRCRRLCRPRPVPERPAPASLCCLDQTVVSFLCQMMCKIYLFIPLQNETFLNFISNDKYS